MLIGTSKDRLHKTNKKIVFLNTEPSFNGERIALTRRNAVEQVANLIKKGTTEDIVVVDDYNDTMKSLRWLLVGWWAPAFGVVYKDTHPADFNYRSIVNAVIARRVYFPQIHGYDWHSKGGVIIDAKSLKPVSPNPDLTILEVSSAGPPLGQIFSAFNLRIYYPDIERISGFRTNRAWVSLEALYQAMKVGSDEILHVLPKDIKRLAYRKPLAENLWIEGSKFPNNHNMQLHLYNYLYFVAAYDLINRFYTDLMEYSAFSDKFGKAGHACQAYTLAWLISKSIPESLEEEPDFLKFLEMGA